MRIANAFEFRIEAERPQDADVDQRLRQLRKREQGGERPRVELKTERERSEHDTRKHAITADVGERDGETDRRPDRRRRPTARGGIEDQRRQPPQCKRDQSVEHDRAGKRIGGKPRTRC